jgi:hypothetical protein
MVFSNFPWGKFLIGWDALNPEFNIPLNFQRSFFASWQENYGLGTLTGHGFATQLPHTMIISILSRFFPIWAIRSVFIFLCLYLGGLGIYFFARLLFHRITVKEYRKKFFIAIEYICLLVALFYCLNLATVQMFYLPLEAFIVHFAALPWLFWIIIRLAGKTDKKNLILFSIINFFASIAGFIPSLFVTYAISLFLFASVYIVINKFHWIVVKKSLLVLFLTFLINAYWLLPFGYYQISRGRQTENAYNNLMTTEDFILKNKKYGNLENVALMKGFSFDMQELGGYVFQPWIEHYDRSEIQFIGYSLFIFVLVSALLSLFLIRHVLVKITSVIFLYFLTSLATDFPIFSQFTQMIQALSPSYYQAFRTAFTKFALGYSFLFSLFLGIGLYILLGYFYRLLKHRVISLSIFLGLFFLLIYYAYPVFKGNLLYKKLQVNIPPAYFEVFDFFKNKGDDMIADFPQDCAEGWYGYNWGYFGSGFYWYAIKQPILARSFDVWSSNSENYYWQVVQAVRSKDFKMFDALMQKYNVKWVLYDPNLMHCRSAKAFFGYEDFVKHLEESNKYKLVKTSTPDRMLPIKIYENLETNPNNFVFLADNLPIVGPTYSWDNLDKAYLDYGDYVANSNLTIQPSDNVIYYPLRSLFTGRKQEELEFMVEDAGEEFVFKAKIPKELVGGKLVVPKLVDEEISEIDSKDLSQINKKYPQVFLDGEVIYFDYSASLEIPLSYISDGDLEIRVPKIEGYYSQSLLPNAYSLTPNSCDLFNTGVMTREIRYVDNSPLVRFSSIGSSNCLDFDLPKLTQKLGYLVSVENRNIEGKSLLFNVINKNSQRADLETYLPKQPTTYNTSASLSASPQPTTSHFVIPPMEEFGQGYSLHFDNISIGRVSTINDLGQITVNPIPYRFLTGLKIVKNQITDNSQQITKDNISVSHPNPSFYEIGFNNETMKQCYNEQCKNITLVLSQSYDSGWHAYQITNDWLTDSWYMKLLIPLFQPEIKDHVLVNNWENGWRISRELVENSQSSSKLVGNSQELVKNGQSQLKIVIIYLPQYLEYIGLLLLLMTFLGSILIRNDRKSPNIH